MVIPKASVVVERHDSEELACSLANTSSAAHDSKGQKGEVIITRFNLKLRARAHFYINFQQSMGIKSGLSPD